MPVEALWELSRHWYDGRLSLDWTPRSRAASQQMLTDAGFIGPFWSLGRDA